jgi:hypothetical protein
MAMTRAASSLLLGALLTGLAPGASFAQATADAYLSFLMARRLVRHSAAACGRRADRR